MPILRNVQPIALRPQSPSSLLAVGTLLLAAALVAPGCLLHSTDMTRTRRAFERQYPEAQFDRDLTLDLGPLTMAMSAGLTRRWAPEAFKMAGPYLRYVERVEVGVYEASNLPPLGEVDASALPVLHEGGWETVLRVREPEEHVWVLARPGRHTLRAFYVLVLGEDELVATRLEGRLDKVLEHALETHGDVLDDGKDVPQQESEATAKRAP